jgi:hypothetical protein
MTGHDAVDFAVTIAWRAHIDAGWRYDVFSRGIRRGKSPTFWK